MIRAGWRNVAGSRGLSLSLWVSMAGSRVSSDRISPRRKLRIRIRATTLEANSTRTSPTAMPRSHQSDRVDGERSSAYPWRPALSPKRCHGPPPSHRRRRRLRSRFALVALLGFQFAPRIPDLKSRRLYSFAKPSAYPTLEPLIAGRINVALIRAHWAKILRVAASIRTGTVTASLIMRQLAPTRDRTAWPRRCASWAGWSAPCSLSIGSRTWSCAGRQAVSSTKAQIHRRWSEQPEISAKEPKFAATVALLALSSLLAGGGDDPSVGSRRCREAPFLASRQIGVLRVFRFTTRTPVDLDYAAVAECWSA